MLQRIWGQDAAFLAQHNDLYRSLLADAYLRRATVLIKLGRTAEARAELKRAANASLLARSKLALMSFVPDPCTRALLAVRRLL